MVLAEHAERKEELRNRLREIVAENLRLKGQIGLNDLYDTSFHLDTDPFSVNENDNEQSYNPILYDSFNDDLVLQNISSDSLVISQPSVVKFRNRCFNCDGDHMITNCTLPKDRRKIARNKREFMLKNAKNGTTPVRYHIDKLQKFSHISPGGNVSKRLRKALGLKYVPSLTKCTFYCMTTYLEMISFRATFTKCEG